MAAEHITGPPHAEHDMPLRGDVADVELRNPLPGAQPLVVPPTRPPAERVLTRRFRPPCLRSSRARRFRALRHPDDALHDMRETTVDPRASPYPARRNPVLIALRKTSEAPGLYCSQQRSLSVGMVGSPGFRLAVGVRLHGVSRPCARPPRSFIPPGLSSQDDKSKTCRPAHAEFS